MARDHDTPGHGHAITRSDPYLLPELYELEHHAVDEDVAHYQDLARACRNPVLELGAGTGRLTLPMARVGATVHALDRAAPMLAVLRARAAVEPHLRIEARLGDLHQPLGKQAYDLIVFALNGLQHLGTADEVAQLFRNARRAVTPGGAFALDAYLPHPSLFNAFEHPPGPVLHLDPRTGRAWRSEQRSQLDPDGRRLVTDTTWINRDGTTAHTRMVQHLHPLPVLLHAATAAGWTVERSDGDFEGGPLDDDALKWVGVLRAGR